MFLESLRAGSHDAGMEGTESTSEALAEVPADAPLDADKAPVTSRDLAHLTDEEVRELMEADDRPGFEQAIEVRLLVQPHVPRYGAHAPNPQARLLMDETWWNGVLRTYDRRSHHPCPRVLEVSATMRAQTAASEVCGREPTLEDVQAGTRMHDTPPTEQEKVKAKTTAEGGKGVPRAKTVPPLVEQIDTLLRLHPEGVGLQGILDALESRGIEVTGKGAPNEVVSQRLTRWRKRMGWVREGMGSTACWKHAEHLGGGA